MFCNLLLNQLCLWVSPAISTGAWVLHPFLGRAFALQALSKRQFVTAHPLPHQAQSYTTGSIYNRLSLLHKYLYQRKQWKDQQKLVRLVHLQERLRNGSEEAVTLLWVYSFNSVSTLKIMLFYMLNIWKQLYSGEVVKNYIQILTSH